MPIIQWTPNDLMINKTIERQWVPATITKVEGPLKAASGNSYNYFITFTLDAVAPGKEIRECFNNTRGNGNLLPIFAATAGITMEEAAKTPSNTDDLLHKQLDVDVAPDTYNGQLRNVILNYLPLGKGTANGNSPAF